MTSKERAVLRAAANTFEPILHIGKEGISPALVQQVWEALEARELIKGTVLPAAPLDAREAVAALCEATHAQPVQVIGRRFVIYRKASKNSQYGIE